MLNPSNLDKFLEKNICEDITDKYDLIEKKRRISEERKKAELKISELREKLRSKVRKIQSQ